MTAAKTTRRAPAKKTEEAPAEEVPVKEISEEAPVEETPVEEWGLVKTVEPGLVVAGRFLDAGITLRITENLSEEDQIAAYGKVFYISV